MKQIILFLLFLPTLIGKTQPQPGDIFRDYIWTTGNFSQPFLRVIGDGDYRDPVHFSRCFPEEQFIDGWLMFPGDIDLKMAVRAELQIEKLQSHDGTRGLSVKVNNSSWIRFPESITIPEPQWDYLHQTFPLVNVPLEHLAEGVSNKLRFRVDSLQRFNMPQNILYGIHLRIYYAPAKKHAEATISGIFKNGTIDIKQSIQLENISGNIKTVDFIGLYTDVNYEGDGNYHQWHYTFYRGEMQHQIGHVDTAPFQVTWNTEWIPDQKEPMQIAALIKNTDDLVWFSPPVTGLTIIRDFRVILCKPFNQPKMWATRDGEFTEIFNLPENPQEASAFQLVWSSWSPGYLNGIYLNEWVFLTQEGCRYCPAFHRFTSERTYMLQEGDNIMMTGKTPKIFSEMVHGTEIQYPGIMALVKFSNNNKQEK